MGILYKQEGKGSRATVALGGRHTTDAADFGMQSVLETNDLNELMNMVRLTSRLLGVVCRPPAGVPMGQLLQACMQAAPCRHCSQHVPAMRTACMHAGANACAVFSMFASL